MNGKITLLLLLSTVISLVGMQEALALPGYLTTFDTTYPFAVGSRIDNCGICHINPAGGGPLDPYGTSFSLQPTRTSQAFINIEPLDSDGDGFTNIAEITNFTYPGNASDFPHVITSIVVSPSTATLVLGGNQLFIASARDQNNNPMQGTNIAWSVSNFAVGSVIPVSSITGPDGNASTTFTANATNVGSAFVNATNGTVVGSANVIVTAPVLTTITVSPPTASLFVSGTQMFNATARDQNGAPMSGIIITWMSNNTAVGNVTPAAATTGLDGNASTTFTASTAGVAMITATNGIVVGSANVTVTAVPPVLTTITVSPRTALIATTGSQVFTATARDQNGAPMPGIIISWNWTTNNTAIGNVTPLTATTGPDGNASTTFSSVAAGNAIVTATNGNLVGSADVTIIVVPTLTTITVSPPTALLTPGGIQAFNATAKDQNGAPMSGIVITWTSNNTAVGDVAPLTGTTGPDGNASTTFTSATVGSAMVTASNGTVVGRANVTVLMANITDFNVGNGSRAGAIRANVTVINLDSVPHWFAVVVSGVDLTGYPLAGTGVVNLSAGQNITIPMLVTVPAGADTGSYSLFAGVYPFDNQILDPASLIGNVAGPRTAIVS